MSAAHLCPRCESSCTCTGGNLAYKGICGHCRRPVIVTSFVYPPIPVRDYDWCAYRDGDEETGRYGWGKTERDALAALMDMEDERKEEAQ